MNAGGSANNAAAIGGAFTSNLNNAPSNSNWRFDKLLSKRGGGLFYLSPSTSSVISALKFNAFLSRREAGSYRKKADGLKVFKNFNAAHNPHHLVKISRLRAGIVALTANLQQEIRKMKTYKNLFEVMLKPETVSKCMLDAAEGKLKRREVLNAFKNFDETYDLVVKCATDPDYKPREDNRHEIIDGANHKPRQIEKPQFCPEQILHHMLIDPFKPVLLNGLYEEVYGCLPPLNKNGKIKKFGPHAAIRRLKRWVQTGGKIYVCETDIHHAYQSVNIKILAEKLRRVIKDKDWLNLMFKFLKGNDGLILGHYTSPWLFNFYLKDFDHFAAALDGIKYLRFADNIYLVGTNKRKVHRALNSIREYLDANLKLKLNKSTQVYRFEWPDKKSGKIRGRAVNALGAVIHYNRVTLRKSILKRMRRKALKLRRKFKITWHDAASMLSRLSWIRYTDTFLYYSKYIKPKINIKKLKAKLRAHSRAIAKAHIGRRRIIYDGLGKSSRLAGAKTGGV